MIEPLIAPIVFPSADGNTAASHRSNPSADRRTLPLPTFPVSRTGTTVYGMAAVDCGGRVADTVVLRTLAWKPGTTLAIGIRHGLVLARADAQGRSTVTPQGFLRLPVSLRRRMDLHAGDRVLLAAYPEHGALIVHPPVALDDLLAEAHITLLGGDGA